MLTGFRGRATALLVAAALVGGAVLARVWLAATGGYSEGTLSVPLRVASVVSLFAGLLLAALAVAWPMRRPKAYRQHSATGDPASASSLGKAAEDQDT